MLSHILCALKIEYCLIFCLKNARNLYDNNDQNVLIIIECKENHIV